MESTFVKTTLLFTCAVASLGCGDLNIGFQGVEGSGVAAKESRKAAGEFTKIVDEGFANVDVQVGTANSVRVEGDDNIVPLVNTIIENGVLRINTKKSVKPKKKLLVTVTVKNLKEIQLDGAGNITVNNVSADNFLIGLDGAGNMSVSGKTKTLTASLEGAGNLKLDGLQAEKAKATLDGAGNADLWVTGALEAHINGVGNIKYKGSPQVTKTIDGVGRIAPY